jgi:hypothetical protein
MAEISYFAAALGISLEAAAAMLGIRHAAEGGRTPASQPVLVGERGPEIIYPAEPSMIQPLRKVAPNTWYRPAEIPAVSPRVGPWDQWLADLPESKNVQNLRSPEQIADDNRSWRVTWDPTFENPYEAYYEPGAPGGKTLVQFPPAAEAKPTKSTVPGWLADQEKIWLTKKGDKKGR